MFLCGRCGRPAAERLNAQFREGQFMKIHKNPVNGVSMAERRQWLKAAAFSAGGLLFRPAEIRATLEDGILRNAEAIHQEVSFQASPKRVYQALLDAKQFQKVQMLSDAVKSLDIAGKPAEINAEPGGRFSLFAAYIVGRQVELLANQRIVQAWRAMSWDPGAYSIARFEISPQGTGSKIVFDHSGFPAGTAEHLAAGWKAHYWEPLAKFLA
jgi:activator of HSP90 ATPase